MIRKAKLEDLEDILNIYHYAREYMKKNGNSTQWGNIHPAQSLIEEDIKKGISYVLYDDEGLYGVFALIYGKDPTYQKIYDGKQFIELHQMVEKWEYLRKALTFQKKSTII